MARDNFTQKVINDLRNRVGLRCSKPNCRVPTIAPSNNIGQAAHICAASSGGPRYDKSMTSEKRKSIDNAIWLCSNHAMEIDRNLEKFPIELLYEWKRVAELFATQELGQRLPNKTETMDTISSALTGLPTTFIPTAISNIHLASIKSLEALDTRFSVNSSYIDNMTTFEIKAKEKVSLSINIDKNYSVELNKKYRALMEHGKNFKIDAMAIEIKGSRLFEEISSYKNGYFELLKTKKRAIQKLWLIDTKTNKIEFLDDIIGEISSGNKSFSFEGTTFDKLIYFNYQYSLEKKLDLSMINLGISFKYWNDLDVNKLPYFKKIQLLYSKILDGWELNTSLEIDGETVFTSDEMQPNTSSSNINFFLDYIKQCRILSNYLNIKVIFSSDIIYSPKEHEKLLEVVRILEKKEVFYKDDIKNNANFTLIINQDIPKDIINEVQSVRFIPRQEEKIKLFDNYYLLPKKVMYLDSVYLSFDKKLKKIMKGDSVKTELIPAKDFEYRIEFEK